jgi:preprotein translocase subunit SecE
MGTIFSYFSSIKLEMKKVSWSSKQELIGSTVIVFVFAIILGIFLWFLDDILLGPVAEWIYLVK